MKLKYYLRGLGIGIIVTALLMGFATKDKKEMTDEEIKARAASLGMVEQKVLADINNTAVPDEEALTTPEPVPTRVPEESEKPVNTKEPEFTAEPETTMKPEVTEEPAVTQEPEPTKEPEPTQEPEATKEPEPTPEPTKQPQDVTQPDGDTITLTINSGETSWSISKTLYDLGMVESASEFDSYLCKNGYDKTIRIGTFEIPKGATYEEIAKLIAR